MDTYFCAGVFLLLSMFFLACHAQNKNNDEHAGQVFVHYEKLVGRRGEGFGYLLMMGKDTLIKQDIIPAVQGIRTFKTEEDAKKVAKLVIEKLHNQQSPAVDSLELVRLGISF